jgi:hypothetical protein
LIAANSRSKYGLHALNAASLIWGADSDRVEHLKMSVNQQRFQGS